jgi:hypothetical protein
VQRLAGFSEIEQTLSEDEAMREASRCLRCDLEFTLPKEEAEVKTAAPVEEGVTR